MTTRPRRPESESGNTEGTDDHTPGETPMERFKSVTRRLLNVSRDELRAAQEEHERGRPGRTPRGSKTS
jgi:hypothetical protein